MPKTSVNCPNCRQPVVVEVQQLFDVSQDPLAKQKLLTNSVNFIQCPTCRYQGLIGVPIVYHDLDKELLLTFFPPDLNTPLNEQEKQIGPLITRIMDRLPNEKKKAYLLQPKSMLTYQSLIENILEADGITKEMIEGQQKRIGLIERLIQTNNKEERQGIIKQDENLIDGTFFSLFSRIIQSASAQSDNDSQEKMKEIQNELFETTEVGRELLRNAKDTETAIKKLQEASKDGLTREKLLDLLLSAENDLQLSTMASLARSGLDYQFFQLLTEKIDSASNDKKNRLTKTRERLLDITDEIDKRLQEEMKKASDNLNKVLDAENTEEMLLKNPEIIDEFFYQQLEATLKHARKAGDLERITKLEKIMGLIEKAMAPSEELQLLQELLGIENEKELIKKIDENIERITPEFMSILNIMITQTENQQDQPELKERIMKLNRTVLRASMMKNLMQDNK
jgi:hypothetical protein